jgi:multicomponent Na+:H+ antiporter subunit G
MLGGTAFMVIAALGLMRLPDLYMRMHAITKAGTLGVGLLLVGVAVHFGDLSVSTRAAAVILFVLFTAPVSGHMIGRAGYLERVPLWDGTQMDEWQSSFEDMHYEENTIEQPAVPGPGGQTHERDERPTTHQGAMRAEPPPPGDPGPAADASMDAETSSGDADTPGEADASGDADAPSVEVFQQGEDDEPADDEPADEEPADESRSSRTT